MIPAKSLAFFARPARNFGVSSVAFSKVTDPIQKLFLDQIKEYKSKSSGGKMVDSNPQIEQERRNELERVAKQFGGGDGTNMIQFPEFKFADPKIDAVTQ